jgi:aminopeptidase-like protein
MLLERLQTDAGARAVAEEAFGLMRELYPICRSITGDGVRHTLDLLHAWAPLKRSEVPSGTAAYDWEVPQEWNISDAYVARVNPLGTDSGEVGDPGARLIDFKAHSLHVMSYSKPVQARMSRDELEPHLHSLPDQPDCIPYRTSYYRENWGFCLSQHARDNLGPGPFDVCINSSLTQGHLSYGECVVPGDSTDEVVIYTHVCHPSLANDNLTGMAVAAALARELRQQRPQLTWRFVFAPGTIGSLTWLSRNEALLPRIRAGLVIGLLGDAAPLTFKRSRRGDTLIDRVAPLMLAACGGREIEFEPYGYDERQFCSPGFDLPFGRLTRSPNGTYPQYHNSSDNLDFVSAPALAGALQALARIAHAVDANRHYINLSPKGEPRLGKRGLYGNVGGGGPGAYEQGLLWLLNQSDGRHDLVAIAQRSGLPFSALAQGAQALVAAGLLAPCDEQRLKKQVQPANEGTWQ